MKNLYLLLMTLSFSVLSFGQTQITSEPFTGGTIPAGWAQTSVTFTPGAYAFFTVVGTPGPTATGSRLTSPSFNVSAYGNIVLNFEVAKIGNGQTVDLAVEYAIDGGAFQVGTIITRSTNGDVFEPGTLTILNPGTNILVRFKKTAGTRDVALRNLVITGNCTQPATQATNYTTTNLNGPTGSATLNWTRGSGNNVLVVVREAATGIINPSSGTTYTGNTAFGSGQTTGTGNFVVYNGPASTVNITNLSPLTTYNVAIYEYSTANTCYKVPALTGSFSVPCATPINITGLTTTSSSQQVILNWTNSSCFDEVLVVAKASSAVTAVPTGDGSAYTANAAFGSGTAIAPNEFVVYKNTGASVTVTSLTNFVNYHFKVFTRKGTNWSSGVVTNATPTYCTSASSDNSREYISNVTLNTINNNSGPGFYTYFTGLSTDLGRGTPYPISITPTFVGAAFTEVYKVWIDFNKDGVFADPGELVFTQTTNQSTAVTGSFSIPVSAALGTTRMRVSMKATTGAGPCESFQFGEVEDYNVNIIPPITYIYNNGWSPFNPNFISNSLNNISVVNGPAVINSTITANSVTVASTGSLTVNSGNTFTVLNNVFMQSNSINYSSLIVNGTINGTVNYTRHVNSGSVGGVGGNDLISAPLGGQTFNVFKLANGNIKTNPAGTLNLFGPFEKPSNVFLTYANGDTSTLESGQGYRAASTDGGGFTFTGTVNTGTVNRTIEISGTTFAAWNLIGNPYPSYLYVKEQIGAGAHPGFLNTNGAQFNPSYAAIYGYDDNPGDGNIYTIWNLANTTSSTAITPGQGFFVASNTGGGSVDFTADMRTIGNTDDFIIGRQANEHNNATMRLNLTNASQNFVTDFYFNDASTLGLDPGYDAGMFGGSTPAFSIFSQLVEDNSGVNMAIQSLPYSSLASEVIVPIGLRVTQGQQVTISMLNSTIPADVEVYLEDTMANTTTLLTASDYVFTTTSNLNGVGRFFLRFTSSTLSTPESNLNGLQVYTTASPRTLFIKGQLSAATEVALYDIQGRKVVSSTLDMNSNSNQVDVSNLSTGVYVVKLSNSAQQKTQKVILN